LKAANFEQICQWIVSAWESASTHIICKSFKARGITNNVDGSENFLITCFKQGHACAQGAELLSRSSPKVTTQELTEDGCPLEEEETYIDEDDFTN